MKRFSTLLHFQQKPDDIMIQIHLAIEESLFEGLDFQLSS